MKTFLSFLLALLPLAASGAIVIKPPVILGPGTTNTPAVWTNIVRIIATNSASHASKLTPGGTLPPLNAANLTNLPSSGGGAGTFNTSQFDVSGGATNIKSGALVTNLNMRDPSYVGNLLSTNAYSVVRGVVTDAQGNGGQILQQLIPGDTNAGTYTFVSSTVSNSWNPAVNAASPFRSLNDAQLHYGQNMPGMPGYKASLPTWLRGFEPVWFNPFREPQMEIYDRVTFTNGLLSGTDVGFGYTVGLETGTVEATVNANSVGFRSQFGNPTPWMTIASDTNNVGTVTLKGQLNFINSTNEWLMMDDGNQGLIGTRGSNYLFSDNLPITMWKDAAANASDLRLRFGPGGVAMVLRANGTNASDVHFETGNDALGWYRLSEFPAGLNIGPSAGFDFTFRRRDLDGLSRLYVRGMQAGASGIVFDAAGRTNTLIVLESGDVGIKQTGHANSISATNTFILGANSINSWDDVTNYFAQTGSGGSGVTNNQILPGVIAIQQLTDAGDPHLLSGTNFEGVRVFYIDELGVYHGAIASGVTNITASGGATASTPDGGRTFNIDVAGGGGAVTNFGVTASGGNTATTNGNVVTVVGTVDIAKAGGAGTNNYLRGPTIGGVQTNDSLVVSGSITRTNYTTGIRSVESAAGHLFYPTNSATPTININGVTGEITAGNFIGGGSLTDLKLTNSAAGGSTFYDGDDGAQTGTMNNAGTLTLPKFVATGTPGFSGDGSGLTGLIDSQIPNNITIDLATVASAVTVVDGTDSTSFVGIFDSATGSLAAKTDGALLYNATSGALAATSFFGAGGALTYTGGGNNGNLATTVDTIQELNDAVDNLSLGGFNPAVSNSYNGTFTGNAAGLTNLDATLTALAGLDTTPGVVVQTGTDTFTKRTITGTANEVEVTNGDGVSGNPTIGLPDTVAITTLATGNLKISSNSWLTIPVLAEGDIVPASSNGTPYIVARYAGVQTTNPVLGSAGGDFLPLAGGNLTGPVTHTAANNATTSPAFLTSSNTQIATSGNPKGSYGISLWGNGFGTTGSTNAPVGFSQRVLPTSAATAGGSLIWSNQLGSAAPTKVLELDQAGNLTALGNVSGANVYGTTIVQAGSQVNAGTTINTSAGVLLAGQIALSGLSAGVNHLYLGHSAFWSGGIHLGVDSSNPLSCLYMYGPDRTGTDAVGPNRTWYAPNGTGTGGGGSHVWATAGPRATGSTAATQTNQMTLSPTGSLWVANGIISPMGAIISSNSFLKLGIAVAALAPGDRYDFSSNGTPFVVWKNLAGALTTNNLSAGGGTVSSPIQDSGSTDRFSFVDNNATLVLDENGGTAFSANAAAGETTIQAPSGDSRINLTPTLAHFISANVEIDGDLQVDGTMNIAALNTPTLTVTNTANIRTNIAQFDVDTTAFVIGTRYTNSTRRSFVTASFQLSAAAAGTAAVSLRCEQAGVTNRVNISAGPLASLATVEQLSLFVGPGAFYTFVDDTSGTGASVAIVSGTSSRTDW